MSQLGPQTLGPGGAGRKQCLVLPEGGVGRRGGRWLGAPALWEHLSGAWTAGDASWKVFFTTWNLFWHIDLLLCVIFCYQKRKEVRVINSFASL